MNEMTPQDASRRDELIRRVNDASDRIAELLREIDPIAAEREALMDQWFALESKYEKDSYEFSRHARKQLFRKNVVDMARERIAMRRQREVAKATRYRGRDATIRAIADEESAESKLQRMNILRDLLEGND